MVRILLAARQSNPFLREGHDITLTHLSSYISSVIFSIPYMEVLCSPQSVGLLLNIHVRPPSTTRSWALT